MKHLFILCIVVFVSTAAFSRPKQWVSETGISRDTLIQGRKQIDSIDRQLIRLLGAREQVVKMIGQYKKDHHIPPLQPARFQEVLSKAVEEGKSVGLSADFVGAIFTLIHEESLKLEK